MTMQPDPTPASSGPTTITWASVRQALTRPYPVTIPMLVLVALVPAYLAIAARAQGPGASAPVLPVDNILPLVPAWALVYGALYGFLILLPVFVVQQPDLIRRTVWAYLLVWLTSYLVFLALPTVAPRPARVMGDGFAVWGLRFLYAADPPYNCFPSLHVAHSFVSALACYRVHRPLGVFAGICASLVAVSTLFTKQHYLADVLAGVLLAAVAYVVFLRGHARSAMPSTHSRVAVALAFCVSALVALALACFWLAYRLGLGPQAA
jgi:membrane-associated phospholipid phosphatase